MRREASGPLFEIGTASPPALSGLAAYQCTGHTGEDGKPCAAFWIHKPRSRRAHFLLPLVGRNSLRVPQVDHEPFDFRDQGGSFGFVTSCKHHDGVGGGADFLKAPEEVLHTYLLLGAVLLLIRVILRGERERMKLWCADKRPTTESSGKFGRQNHHRHACRQKYRIKIPMIRILRTRNRNIFFHSYSIQSVFIFWVEVFEI